MGVTRPGFFTHSVEVLVEKMCLGVTELLTGYSNIMSAPWGLTWDHNAPNI